MYLVNILLLFFCANMPLMISRLISISWFKFISASPDTLSSPMLLRRKLLILLKQENERSASQLPTGRVHAIFSKTAMFGNTSQSACWRHCFRLTAETLTFFFQNLCHCFSSVLSVVGCGRSLFQNKSPLTSSARSASTLVTAPGSSPRRWAPFLDSASKRLLKSLSKWSEKVIATLRR